MSITFENPSNGHRETVENAFLKTFLGGCFYLGAKGAMGAAVMVFAASLLTGGLAWLVVPFFAEEILRRHYLRQGWREVDAPKKAGAERGDDPLFRWVAGLLALGAATPFVLIGIFKLMGV